MSLDLRTVAHKSVVNHYSRDGLGFSISHLAVEPLAQAGVAGVRGSVDNPQGGVMASSVLVTGASRGIGKAIAEMLSVKGFGLTLVGRQQQSLDDVATQLADETHVRTVVADMADEAAVAELVAGHVAAHGGLSGLVLAAGVGSSALLDGYPMKRYDKQFDVNLRSPFMLVSHALPHLVAAAKADPKFGARIVAMSSVEGIYAEPGLVAYGATKAGLISLLDGVNAEHNADGVVATAISPGFVATSMSEWVTDRVPVDEMISVADIVAVAELAFTVSGNAVLPHIEIRRRGAPLGRA